MNTLNALYLASLSSEPESTSTDPIAYIDQFTQIITDLFHKYVLNLADEFWSSYYGIFYIFILLWAIYMGLKYMAGASGKDVRAELKRAGRLALLMFVGYMTIPIVELCGDYISTFVIKQSTELGITIQQAIENENNAGKLDLTSDTPENRALRKALSKSDMNSYNIAYSLQKEAETDANQLSSQDALAIERIKHESGVETAELPDANEFIQAPKIENLSLLSGNLLDIITYILILVGNVLKSLMLIFRLFLLTLFRFSFPIALALSFIPVLKDTIVNWLQSYVTVVLLGVVLTLIGTISSFIAIICLSSAATGTSFIAALMAFMCGVFYMLSPTITVMLFGGSSTVAQLPQQFVLAAAGVIAACKIFPALSGNKGQTPTETATSTNSPISPNTL